MRGFKTGTSAQTVCAGHGFVRHLQRGCDRLGLVSGDPAGPQPPRLMRAWDDLTAELLAG